MPHLHYLPEAMGNAVITPITPVQVGSFATLTFVYTAGQFGIDDNGGIKICFRATSDMGKPQFSDPTSANYVSVRSSNGVVLGATYDAKLNIRPWPGTVSIRALSGFLRPGDTITVVFGDRSGGSPGMRMQTNVEDTFEFLTLVDAFSAYEFVPLPSSPEIALVPGPAATWRLILPTERTLADPVRLAIVPADRWGNPTAFPQASLRLRADPPIPGLPEILEVTERDAPLVIEDLRPATSGDYRIHLLDGAGQLLATSNPMRIGPTTALKPYWADLHGQSEETIGTNSADAYFRFARDRAFLDVTGHQGNDFQITPEFWRRLNTLFAEYNAPGRFVTIPGYEWSGNTSLGGDHNVFWENENEPIFRSSRVLTPDMGPEERDCHDVNELFAALDGRRVAVVAHVGGRYADLRAGHDGRIETSVEIHSSWGTFEWLLHDAFDIGFRAGIVCNSDDHKGRQGATSPGASQHGAIGGLTCLLMPALERPAVFEALRSRRHYGTTGCRMLLHLAARLPQEVELFDRDPAVFPAAEAVRGRVALMGHIVRGATTEVALDVDAIGSVPIDRVEVFDGRTPLACVRGAGSVAGSRRVRVLWEGAEYRGRGRQTSWNGTAELTGNRILRSSGVNFLNADNPLVQDGHARLSWRSMTTGNMAGFDAWLENAEAGEFSIRTPHVDAVVPVREIGREDRVFEAGGLGRRLRVFRLPEEGGREAVRFSITVTPASGRDTPIFVRVTQEDGHQAWSSPIYFIP